MKKKPYFFDRSSVETGKKFAPRRYDCFYIISPEKIYLFYLSKDASKAVIAGILGGSIGAGIYKTIKNKEASRANKENVEEYEHLKDLPTELRKKIPPFNEVIIIPKESVSKIKFSFAHLVINLKNKEWFSILTPLIKRETNARLKNYLKLTKWV